MAISFSLAMDRLHAEMRWIIEAAAAGGEDRVATFLRVRERALAALRQLGELAAPSVRRYPRPSKP